MEHPESVQSHVIKHEDIHTLPEFLNKFGHQKVVIKPTMGASGYLAYKLDLSDHPISTLCEISSLYRQLKKDALIQPYQKEIETAGEYSLIFFGNEFSHAIHKKPSEKDFRVQSRFGGKTTLSEKIDNDMIRQATAILERLDEVPLYARVDGLWDGKKFTLGELELNEPYLAFSLFPPSINKFINTLEGYI